MIKKLEHGSTRHFWNPLKRVRNIFLFTRPIILQGQGRFTKNVCHYNILSFTNLEAGLCRRSFICILYNTLLLFETKFSYKIAIFSFAKINFTLWDNNNFLNSA